MKRKRKRRRRRRRRQYKYQSGFRGNHSTTTVLTDVCEFIRKALDRGNCVALILLEFSKAFNSISFHKLSIKLYKFFNFSQCAIKLINSYLTNRLQFVQIDSMLSKQLKLSAGVPQGSILGPLIFSLYINDIVPNIQFCKSHLFADDLQIFTEINTSNSEKIVDSLVNSFKNINSDLSKIHNWAKINDLLLNASKSQAIMFGKPITLKSIDNALPKLILGDDEILFTNRVRNLGLIMTPSLDWDDHIKLVCQRMSFALRVLRLCSSYTPRSVKTILIKSFVLSHLFYCDVIYSDLPQKIMKRITKIYHSCLRYIFHLRRYDHISHLYNYLFGCSIKKYFDFRVAVFIFKIILNKVPAYLHELFKMSISTRTKNIIIPQHNGSIMNPSILVRGAKIWNSLPSHVRSVDRVELFERKCLRYFVDDN